MWAYSSKQVLPHQAGVPGGAAGQDDDPPDVAQFEVRQLDAAELDVAAVGQDPAAERIADGLGLFEDLLEHEMLVAALLDLPQIPGDLLDLLGDLLVVDGGGGNALGSQGDHLAVVEVDDLARVPHDRRDVRSQVVDALADPHHQRAALAGADDRFGVVAVDDGHAEGPLDHAQGALDGLHQVPVVEVLHQVSQDFGVGLRLEHVALLAELDLQGPVVLDDPVVDEGDLAGAVRMGVDPVGRPVGRPAGVGDAAGPAQILALAGLLQGGDLAFLLDHELAAGPHDRQPGAVVAPVLQALEALEQHLCRILGSGHSDDAAHGRVLLA